MSTINWTDHLVRPDERENSGHHSAYNDDRYYGPSEPLVGRVSCFNPAGTLHKQTCQKECVDCG